MTIPERPTPASMIEALKLLGPGHRYEVHPHPVHTWLGVITKDVDGQPYHVAFTPREVKAFPARTVAEYAAAGFRRLQAKK